jgi:hypothetical protein
VLINGDQWGAAFLAGEPDCSMPSWIDAYKKVFANCKPDLTPGEVTEAAHLAFAREGTWNNPKVAAGCDAVFGPLSHRDCRGPELRRSA